MKLPLIRVLNAKSKPSTVVTSITLGLVACLIVIGYASYDPSGGFIGSWEELEVVYVAANASSGDVFCKLRNTAVHASTFDHILVNETRVSPRTPLPGRIRRWEYATVVFPYNGTWNDRIEIVVWTESAWPSFRVVDLAVASTSPVEDVYPSAVDLLDTWLRQHAQDIRGAIVLAILLAIVVGACVLKRGRVSLTAFFGAILGFWCYWTILAFIFYIVMNSPSTVADVLFLTLCSGGLSFFTIYVLFTPKSRRQSSRQLS